MSKPNLLVVGFPKCGTTSLFYYLKDHPDVYLPEEKELHYFTHNILEQNQKGPGDKKSSGFHVTSASQYLQLFNSATNEKIIGDFSPSYASYPECISKIKSELNNPKIIVLVRDPIERAFSNYLHLIRDQREKVSFSEAVKLEEERFAEGYGDFWRLKYNSSYYEKIMKFKENFEEVRVLVFEELIKNPKEEIKAIYRFLEIEDDFIPDNLGLKYNEGGTYSKNILTRFLLQRNPIKDLIKKLIPLNLADLKRKALSGFRKPKPKIDSETFEYLKGYFAEDVNKVRKELKLNIKSWHSYQENNTTK